VVEAGWGTDFPGSMGKQEAARRPSESRGGESPPFRSSMGGCGLGVTAAVPCGQETSAIITCAASPLKMYRAQESNAKTSVGINHSFSVALARYMVGAAVVVVFA
jgi:hypothetical protein